MPALLHEYWENEDGGSFGPVRERDDQLRLDHSPNAKLVFSLFASSWHEAMRSYNERLGYGAYEPTDEVGDRFYTEDEKAEQDAYLRFRNVS